MSARRTRTPRTGHGGRRPLSAVRCDHAGDQTSGAGTARRAGVMTDRWGWQPTAWMEAGLPTWRCAPAGLISRRQMWAANLAPGGAYPVARVVCRAGRRWALLYDPADCVPKRTPTPAQLIAVSKMNAARRWCPMCTRDVGYNPPGGTWAAAWSAPAPSIWRRRDDPPAPSPCRSSDTRASHLLPIDGPQAPATGRPRGIYWRRRDWLAEPTPPRSGRRLPRPGKHVAAQVGGRPTVFAAVYRRCPGGCRQARNQPGDVAATLADHCRAMALLSDRFIQDVYSGELESIGSLIAEATRLRPPHGFDPLVTLAVVLAAQVDRSQPLAERLEWVAQLDPALKGAA